MEELLRPTKVSEFIGNKDIVKKFDNWVKEVKKDIYYKKRICFLTGLNGIGKTSLVHIILKKYKFTIHEFQSSNLRIKSERKLYYQTLLFKDIISILKNKKNFRKAIIIDNYESMNTAKQEIFRKTTKMIKDKKTVGIPIIFIGSTFYKKKRPIKLNSIYLRLSPLTFRNISFLYNKIICAI